MRSFFALALCGLAGLTAPLLAQSTLDFEAGGTGADFSWAVFENDTNPPVEVISNPDASGINTSSTVMQFTALMSGQPWAGCESAQGVDLETFSFDETNCTVRVMVHKPTASNVGVRFNTAANVSDPELLVANTVTGQWEELVFDFSGRIGTPGGTDINQIILFPDFDMNGRTQDNLVYIDNVSFTEMIVPDGPQASAPTPTHNAEGVISLYSDAYTNVNVDTWSAVWDQADVGEYMLGEDHIKRYSNLVFAGIEFTSQTINAEAMSHFHFDFWTADAVDETTQFRVKLVDFGANGVWDGGGDDVEHELIFGQSSNPALATGQWVAFDLPLASFTGLVTRGHLAQLVISSDQLNTIYLDNIYFHSGGSAPQEPEVAAPAPQWDAENVISLYSNAYDNVNVDTWSADWDVADLTESTVQGDDVLLYTSFVFAGIEFTSQTIDASEMAFFQMNLWTPDTVDETTIFRVKLVDFGENGVWDGGGDDVEHELEFGQAALASGEWVTLDIPLQNFTGLVTRGHLAQLVIASDQLNTIYVDNVFFHADEIDVRRPELPADWTLEPNVPNPFNPETRIAFTITQPAEVALSVYDLAGRTVKTLLAGEVAAGSHSTLWTGRDTSGLQVASGVYFYQLSLNGRPVETRSMLLLR